MLADRAAGRAWVTLAANEHLTPAARDYAARMRLEVRRAGGGDGRTAAGSGAATGDGAGGLPPPAGGMTAARPQPAVLTGTLGLVVHRPDLKTEALLAGLPKAGIVTAGFAQSPCWMANTQAMGRAIVAGELAGGIILDRYAAAPMVLAGKLRGIRPVQGVSPAAVEAGLRQFDANVLVLGQVPCSVYELRSMIDRFAAGRRMGRQRTGLLERVEQLESCITEGSTPGAMHR
jgi:ribose 5-phosphate isomerase RpiB